MQGTPLTSLTATNDAIAAVQTEINDEALAGRNNETTEGTYLGVIGNEVTALIDDWSDLDIGEEYFTPLGFKLSGDTTYREIPMRGCAEKLLITQDGIRG